MLAGASLNTISEFFLAALPIPAVFYLRIKGRQRWAVISILSMGFLVVLVGCIRVYYIWKGIHTIDVAWWAGPHWICSELEIDTALVSKNGLVVDYDANISTYRYVPASQSFGP
jgi:hypothetical protein